MAKDFFGSLGETLTKTARELSDRAEEVYETQRLKNKISGEERQITKAMADIGKIIYKRYRDGVPLAEEEKAICEQIDERRVQIDKYKEEMNGVKGSRFCPSCGNPLGRNDAFCSKCGVACRARSRKKQPEIPWMEQLRRFMRQKILPMKQI